MCRRFLPWFSEPVTWPALLRCVPTWTTTTRARAHEGLYSNRFTKPMSQLFLEVWRIFVVQKFKNCNANAKNCGHRHGCAHVSAGTQTLVLSTGVSWKHQVQVLIWISNVTGPGQPWTWSTVDRRQCAWGRSRPRAARQHSHDWRQVLKILPRSYLFSMRFTTTSIWEPWSLQPWAEEMLPWRWPGALSGYKPKNHLLETS